jgi:hypothetical protein
MTGRLVTVKLFFDGGTVFSGTHQLLRRMRVHSRLFFGAGLALYKERNRIDRMLGTSRSIRPSLPAMTNWPTAFSFGMVYLATARYCSFVHAA